MNQTTPKTTPFLDSIRWLEVRCGFVPQGWQLANNYLRGLRASWKSPMLGPHGQGHVRRLRRAPFGFGRCNPGAS